MVRLLMWISHHVHASQYGDFNRQNKQSYLGI
jgi:hypothetical protein